MIELHRALAAVGAALCGVSIAAGGIDPRPFGASAASYVPALSVDVDNGGVGVRAGQQVTYTLTVRNEGTSGYEDVVVSQVLPASLVYRSASDAGIPGGTEVSWRLDSLPAGARRTLTMTGEVGSGGRDLLTTTVCVAAGPGRPLSSCDTDADAYVDAEPYAPWAPLATAALAGLVAGGLTMVWRRRPVKQQRKKARR